MADVKPVTTMTDTTAVEGGAPRCYYPGVQTDHAALITTMSDNNPDGPSGGTPFAGSNPANTGNGF